MKYDIKSFLLPNGGGSGDDSYRNFQSQSLRSLSDIILNNKGVQGGQGSSGSQPPAKGKGSKKIPMNQRLMTNFMKLKSEKIQDSSGNKFWMMPDPNQKEVVIDENGDVNINNVINADLQVKFFPDIQFVRRSTTLALNEDYLSQIANLVWDNEKGYTIGDTDNMKLGFQNDMDYIRTTRTIKSKPTKQTGWMTGDQDELTKFLDELQPPLAQKQNSIQSNTQLRATDPAPIPRFHFFFDKQRNFCFDSFVRIHNLFKFARSTDGSDPDRVFHAEGTSGHWGDFSPIRITEDFETISAGGRNFRYIDGRTHVPTRNSGGTLVIDISDQYLPMVIAGPLLLGGALAGAVVWGAINIKMKKGGGAGDMADWGMRIYDQTAIYARIDNAGPITVWSEKDKLIPQSRYAFGTNIEFNTNFIQTDEDKKPKGKYKIRFGQVTNASPSPMPTRDDFAKKEHGYDKPKNGKEKESGYKFALSDAFDKSMLPLPVGKYVVYMYDKDDEKRLTWLEFEIFMPDAPVSVFDKTYENGDNEKLITSGFGVVTNIKGAKYSRYKVGTNLALSVYPSRDVANMLTLLKLSRVAGISQWWSAALYNSSDTSFSKPLWQSGDLKYPDDVSQNSKVSGSRPIVDSKGKYLILNSGDYVLRAVGVVQGGGTKLTSTDLAVISVRNYLSIEDTTQEGDNTTPKDGYFQKIISDNKQIGGPFKDIADDAYFKASTYYTEDLPMTKIYLSFNDKGEHKYKKVIVNVLDGTKLSLGDDDKYDKDVGGYRLDMKLSNGKEIAPGTYKLTCYDDSEESIFDDILLNLIAKATIDIGFGSNSTLSNQNQVSGSSEVLSGYFTYKTSLTETVNLAGYIVAKGENGSEITVDLFGKSSFSGGSATAGDKHTNKKNITSTILSITPNSPVYFTIPMSNMQGAKTITVVLYDTKNEAIYKDSTLTVLGSTGSGTGDNANVVRSQKKSSVKKN